MSVKKCCICGKPFDDIYKMGNNAEPFHSGFCCDKCNKKYVIPSRLFIASLKSRVESLFERVQKEIESGKTKLLYNRGCEFGYRITMKGQPKDLKEWKRQCFLDFCEKDKDIKDLKKKLIEVAKVQLGDIDDVWIECKAEKEEFYFILWNLSLERYFNEREK